MMRKRFSVEQIVQKLRDAKMDLAKVQSIGQVGKQLGITDPTHYPWRKGFGSLKMDQARRPKEATTEPQRPRVRDGPETGAGQLSSFRPMRQHTGMVIVE